MIPTTRRWLAQHEGVAAALVYILILIATYSNVVFQGDSLIHSNNLNMLEYRITERTHGPHFRPATTWTDRNLLVMANMHDVGGTVTQWEPGAVFLQRGLREGELPFWDPYVGAGAPAMSNLTQTFFFPPFFLVVLLGNGVILKNLYFLAQLLAAGWCTWSLARRSGLSWSASFIGGLAFMESGAVTQTVGGIVGQAACCIPIALLVTRWFLERGTWAAAAVLGVVFGSIALASFPPVLSAVFGLCVVYVCIELLVGGEFVTVPRQTVAIQFAAGCALGVGLVAWYYLPSFALMGDTPQVRNYYRGASSETPVFASGLLQLLSPTLMGGVPILLNDPIPRLTVAVFNYVGAVPLLLAALVGWRDLRRPLGLFGAAAAVTIVGLMFGLPPFGLVRELPGMRNIHFGNYYSIPLDFALALLAAAGFARLQRGLTSLRGWVAVLLLVGALLTLIWVALDFGVASHVAYRQWRENFVVLVAIALTASTLVFAAIPAGLGARRQWIGWALVAIAIVEGVTNAHFPRQKRWDVWHNPPAYIAFLEQHAGLGRVFTMGSALYANAGSAFRIMQLDSLMMFNTPRAYEFYLRYAKTAMPLSMRDAHEVPSEAVLDAAGISHILAATDLPQLPEIRARGHELVFDDGLFRVFRRNHAQPRYFFTSDVQVLKRRYALAAVGAPHPARQIVVESEPTFTAIPNPAGEDTPVKVEHFSYNRVRLSLVAPRSGFVYMSESFFPGWTATVNGQRTTIQPANYAFRAVPVPAGRVDVDVRYLPPGLLAGLGISVVSLLLVGGLLRWGRTSVSPPPPTAVALSSGS